ncbi:MAG TPA: hypothetical protein VFP72_00110 [Kineosporiaceae bacterium]|nr:hypothetical protein [Kineosporiaceae bacterium]
MILGLLSAAPSELSSLDVINLFSAAISTVLAIVALALSVFFFVQSKKDAERSEANAAEISASVTRLEKVFDTLYSDTFSMMRETVSDMRKHVWTAIPAGTARQDTQDDNGGSSVEEQAELLEKLSEVSRRVGITDATVAQLRNELAPFIKNSLEAASGENSGVGDNNSLPSDRLILRIIREREAQGKTSTLFQLAAALGVQTRDLVTALFELGQKGFLDWHHAPGQIAGDTPIRWVPPQERPTLLANRKRDGAVPDEQP